VTARDQLLTRVRASLGRSANNPVPEPPAALLELPDIQIPERVARFTAALTALGGNVSIVKGLEEVKTALESIVNGRTFVTPPTLDALGSSRASVTTAEIGINRADYALADTGSLVFLSETGESRLISLLPPIHIGIVAQNKILSGLDELFTLVPEPAANSSSMVIVTGPSRTADIEMRLVRGVHGPGEVHVVIVEDLGD
jgi:L-lactate dehydrogenase complex protein LldG